MTASVLTTSYCVKTERLHNHKGLALWSYLTYSLLRNNPRDPNMHYEPEFTVFLHVTKLLALHVEYSAFDFLLLRSPAQQPLSTPTWKHQSLFRTTAGVLSSFVPSFISSFLRVLLYPVPYPYLNFWMYVLLRYNKFSFHVCDLVVTLSYWLDSPWGIEYGIKWRCYIIPNWTSLL
jgi:hypothetical protein